MAPEAPYPADLMNSWNQIWRSVQAGDHDKCEQLIKEHCQLFAQKDQKPTEIRVRAIISRHQSSREQLAQFLKRTFNGAVRAQSEVNA